MDKKAYCINKSKLLLVIVAVFALLFGTSGFTDEELTIEKQHEKYNNTLKQRYEDPIILNIKLAEKEKVMLTCAKISCAFLAG